MHWKIFWLLPLLWFVAFTLPPMEARSIDVSASEKNATEEDDVDLEQVLADYYDNLAEIWSSGIDQASGEKKDEEDGQEGNAKPKRQDIFNTDFREESENKTQNIYDMTVPITIGNVTYRYLNQSYAGLLDVQRANRERIKDMRLNSIKQNLMNLRGGNSTAPRTVLSEQQIKPLKDMFEKKLKEDPNFLGSSKYAEKRQSFYPTCRTPDNADEEAWKNPHSMNLFFDVYFPIPQNDYSIMIVSAILKLYTKSSQGISLSPMNQTHVKMDDGTISMPNYILVNDDEKRARLSVYWYTRSLKRQRIKKRLLDSQMFTLNREELVDFEVKTAVRSWKESGRNFGLLVTVEDEEGNALDPTKYIHQMNCSASADDVKPLPLFGFDSVAQLFMKDFSNNENSTKNEYLKLFRPMKYPLLGLHMREVSESEIRNLLALKSTHMELDAKFFNMTGRGLGKRISGTSMITDFENVPLGSPIVQSTQDNAKTNTDMRNEDGYFQLGR